MTRALFLDFDGVLHPSTRIDEVDVRSAALQGAPALLQAGFFCWTNQLEQALIETGADDVMVAMHSNWRKERWVDTSLVRAVLGPLGMRFGGMTMKELPRHDSILELCGRAGIDDFLIIDDDRDAFPLDLQDLIVTDPLNGVSDPLVLAKVRAWAQRGEGCARS